MISLQSNEKMLTKPNGKSLPHGKDFPFISLFQERQTDAPSVSHATDWFPLVLQIPHSPSDCNTTLAKTGKWSEG